MLVLCLVGCGAPPDLPDAGDAGEEDACVALACAPGMCGAHDDGCGGALDCGPCEIVCEGDADCETGEVCDLGSGGVCTTGCRTGRRAVIDIPAHPVEVRVTLDGQPFPETVTDPVTLYFEGDHPLHVARVPLFVEGLPPYAGRSSVVARFVPGRYRARIEWEARAGMLIEDIGVVEIDEDTTRLDFDLERVTSTLRLDLAPQWDGVRTVIVHSADFSTQQWARVEDPSEPITLLPMSPGRYFVTLNGARSASGAPNRVLPGTIELAEEVVVEANAAPVDLALTLAGGAAPDAETCLRLQPLPEESPPRTSGPVLFVMEGHARGWAVPGRYRVELACADPSWPRPPPALGEIVVPPEGLTASLDVPMVEVDVTVEIEGMDPAELPPGCVGEVRVGDHPLPLALTPGEHRRVRVTPGEHPVTLRGVYEGCPVLLPDAELRVIVADGAPLGISVATVPLQLRPPAGAPALGAGAKWRVETGGRAVEWVGDTETELRVVPGAVRVYYLPTDDDEATPPWPMGARVVFDGEVREPTTLDLSLDAEAVDVVFTLGGEPMPPLPPPRGGELPRPWSFLAFAGGVYFEEEGIRPVVNPGGEWPRALGSWGLHDESGAVASHVGWSLSPGRYVLSFEKRVDSPMRADSLFPVAGVPLGCWIVE